MNYVKVFLSFILGVGIATLEIGIITAIYESSYVSTGGGICLLGGTIILNAIVLSIIFWPFD